MGLAPFTQQARSLAQDHRLRAPPANPTRHLLVSPNEGLGTRFCGSRGFAPDDRCQDKRFASLCKLICQFKYRVRHGILPKKEKQSLETRLRAAGQPTSAWFLNYEQIKGPPYFL